MTTPSDLPLISTIAVGLSLAFVCGLIASKLRISPLVGYILAGIIIGPYSPGFTADIHIAEQLSEIGVVLLLFGVGLHFSIQDFMEVRKIALIGAVGRITIVSAGCILIAHLWGWSISTGILFGLALSVSSTVVLLRILEANHLLSSLTGKIAIGWLIVEDIAMILALVLIPAFAESIKAGSGGDPAHMGMQIMLAMGKIGLFAAIMFIVGRRALPWLLTAVSRTGSRELFTLAVFSMAMGIAFGAAILFGVSFALGAFFAGMMIRESDLNHEVADRALPFQDAFAVLFFVAIGMLFDPRILIDEPLRVLSTAAIIILGKSVVTYGITKLFHYPIKTRIKLSVGLAQIGEFSFILIALGSSLGLLPDEAKNLILAGALISIALNPLLFSIFSRFATRLNDAPEESDQLAHLENEEKKALKNLVILVGCGRVGSSFIDKLDRQHVDLVIVDRIRERVEELRLMGFHAIAGDATDGETLRDALIEEAFAVIITVPDPFEARTIVEAVQKENPKTRIIVRSHNDDETEFFKSQGVDYSITAQEEVGRRMVHALEDMNLPKHA